MLKEHLAGLTGRAAQASQAAMDAYCWANPPILPLIIAACAGAVGGALFATVIAILVSKRRTSPVVTDPAEHGTL